MTTTFGSNPVSNLSTTIMISGCSWFLKREIRFAWYFVDVPCSSIIFFQYAFTSSVVSPKDESSPSRVSGGVISTSEETIPISSRYFLYCTAIAFRGVTSMALNFVPCQLSRKCSEMFQAMEYIRWSVWLIKSVREYFFFKSEVWYSFSPSQTLLKKSSIGPSCTYWGTMRPS